MAVLATIPTMSNFLVNGYWGGTGHHWTWDPVTVNITGLTAAEQTLAQTALNLWHEVCDIDFVFTTLSANITFTHNGSTAGTTSTWTGTVFNDADVNIGSSFGGGAATGIGGYFFQTYIHEIGHAIGLGHQGPYDVSAVYGTNNIYTNDTWQRSVMSYFPQSNFDGASTDFVITPQMADIHAAQAIYGVQSNPIRATDTVYGFNSTAGSFYNFSTYSTVPAMTLYDTGGVDKLDASLYVFDQTINLTPGTFSSIGGLVGNVGIYLTSVIENATGGSGNDTLIGNDANNILTSGLGNDTFKVTAGGYDTLNGGGGIDTADFSSLNSFVWVSLAFSGTEAWYQPGGVWAQIADISGVENLIGTGYGDTLIGDANTNTITYTGGYDIIDGGTGVDIANFGNYGAAVWVDLAYADEGWSTGQSTLVGNWYQIADLTNMENLVGSTYDDLLKGDGTDNTLTGGAGNDTLMGRGGNDLIDGGGGVDTAMFANNSGLYSYNIAGSSILVSGVNEGTDTVLGNVEMYQFGTQTISRTDLLNAINTQPAFTNNADTVTLPLFGGTFNALGGDDRLSYTGGSINIDGGTGADTVNFNSFGSAVWVNLNTTGTEVWTRDSADLTSGTWRAIGDLTNVENLTGTVYGDYLQGDANTNTITYTGGYDVLDGGTGADTVNFSGYGSAVWVDLTYVDEGWSTGQSTLVGNWYQIADLTNIENLIGTAHADLLRGDGASNTLTGGAGNDTLMGRGGNDLIDGGAGIDTVSFAYGLGTSWHAFQLVGSDVLVSGEGEGTDTVRDNVEFYQFGTQTMSRGDLIASLTPPTFTNGNDIVTLPTLGGTFNALGGDDRLSYTGGSVTIDGGTGADTVNFNSFGAAVWVNLNTTGTEVWTRDYTDLTAGTWRAIGDLTNVENLTGTVYGDYLQGDANTNTFTYNGGYDTVYGEAGSDTIDFSQFGSAVWVSLAYAGSEAWTRDSTNLMSGTWREISDLSGIENITGSALSDTLIGDSGANRLDGKEDGDLLTGGAGADTFVFASSTGLSDMITDFTTGQDILEISATAFDLTAGQTVSISVVNDLTNASSPAGVGQFIFDNSGSNAGQLYWDDNGASGLDAHLIGVLTNVTTLLPSDFHVV